MTRIVNYITAKVLGITNLIPRYTDDDDDMIYNEWLVIHALGSHYGLNYEDFHGSQRRLWGSIEGTERGHAGLYVVRLYTGIGTRIRGCPIKPRINEDAHP